MCLMNIMVFALETYNNNIYENNIMIMTSPLAEFFVAQLSAPWVEGSIPT